MVGKGEGHATPIAKLPGLPSRAGIQEISSARIDNATSQLPVFQGFKAETGFAPCRGRERVESTPRFQAFSAHPSGAPANPAAVTRTNRRNFHHDSGEGHRLGCAAADALIDLPARQERRDDLAAVALRLDHHRPRGRLPVIRRPAQCDREGDIGQVVGCRARLSGRSKRLGISILLDGDVNRRARHRRCAVVQREMHVVEVDVELGRIDGELTAPNAPGPPVPLWRPVRRRIQPARRLAQEVEHPAPDARRLIRHRRCADVTNSSEHPAASATADPNKPRSSPTTARTLCTSTSTASESPPWLAGCTRHPLAREAGLLHHTDITPLPRNDGVPPPMRRVRRGGFAAIRSP